MALQAVGIPTEYLFSDRVIIYFEEFFRMGKDKQKNTPVVL